MQPETSLKKIIIQINVFFFVLLDSIFHGQWKKLPFMVHHRYDINSSSEF